METIAAGSWIDIFFLILCLYTIYIAVSRGPQREILRIIGVLVGSFFAFQHYPLVAQFIADKISFLKVKYCYFSAFLVIFLSITIIFGLLGWVVGIFYKKREISSRERWASLLMGGARFSFLSSVVLFLLHLSPFSAVHVNNSLSRVVFKKIAPAFYLATFKAYKKMDPEAVLSKEVEAYYEAKRSLSESDRQRNRSRHPQPRRNR